MSRGLGASLRRVFGSRIAVRIYLVGLAQVAVVAAGFALLIHASRPATSPIERDCELFAKMVALDVGDVAAIQSRLDLIAAEHEACVALVDPSGALVAHGGEGDCHCPASAGQSAPHDAAGRAGPCAVAHVAWHDGAQGRLELVSLREHRRPPRPSDLRVIAFVLFVVGVSSWLVARSLTRPLGRLSQAARAFGAGDMTSRTGIRRNDELGELARSFDEMATRVAELLRVEKELLANVSHELRTPLARVRVALDLAAEGDAETARESLADIAGDLDELEQIIADVLLAARLDLANDGAASSLPSRRLEPVSVGELLDHAAVRFRAAHPGRSLEVSTSGPLGELRGDAVLLRRALANLLENAHKYTEDPAAPVRLCAEGEVMGRAGGRRRTANDEPERVMGVMVEVADRGVGIRAEDLDRIFEPFFRADRSRTRATGGLGLGLALAKRIVEAHRGTLALESSPGEGTRALLWLPAAVPMAPGEEGATSR